MAEKTANYQLNQWAASDAFLRTDFNADNAKIDAALHTLEDSRLRAATGRYTGTGTYGSANPNQITFPFTPKLVFLMANNGLGQHTVFLWGFMGATVYNNSRHYDHFYVNPSGTSGASFSGNTLSWYSQNSAVDQLNDEDTAYMWFAIG